MANEENKSGKKPTLEEFFSDPRYSEESSFLKSAVEKIWSDKEAEKLAAKQAADAAKPKGFNLFGFLSTNEEEKK